MSTAQVIVYGDVAPLDYQDFSAMLESTLSPLRSRTPQFLVEVTSLRLRSFVARYAQERGYAHFYEPYESTMSVQPVLQVAFLNPQCFRTFDFGSYPTIEVKPTILLVSPHGSGYT